MDHLWRALKQRVSANCPYPTVQQHVDAAIHWVLGLYSEDALSKAGCLAEGFWLRDLLENFWRPTY